jgi:hypothetical protein
MTLMMEHWRTFVSGSSGVFCLVLGLMLAPGSLAHAQNGYGYRGYNVPNLYTGIDPGRGAYGGYSPGYAGGYGLGYPVGYGFGYGYNSIYPGVYGGYGSYGYPGLYSGYAAPSFSYSSSYGYPGSFGNLSNFQLNIGTGYGLGGYGVGGYGLGLGGYPGYSSFGYPAYYYGGNRSFGFRPRIGLFPFWGGSRPIARRRLLRPRDRRTHAPPLPVRPDGAAYLRAAVRSPGPPARLR